MSGQRICFVSIAALALFMIVGCQNSTAPAPQATAAPSKAVVVTSGNGGSTTIFLASADPNNPVMLCTEGTELCPECKTAAVKYFQTGVLDPKCSRTGATRRVTTLITPNVGHQ
jgi:hypothetical protein